MAPVVLCALCLVAAVLWCVYSTLAGIRALITASAGMIVATVLALLMFGLAYLGFNFLIILFTDISVFWDLIVEFYNNMGGILGVILIAIMIGIVGVVAYFAIGIAVILAPIAFTILAGALGIVCVVFEFLEEKSQKCYALVVTQIAEQLKMSPGGSR